MDMSRHRRVKKGQMPLSSSLPVNHRNIPLSRTRIVFFLHHQLLNNSHRFLKPDKDGLCKNKKNCINSQKPFLEQNDNHQNHFLRSRKKPNKLDPAFPKPNQVSCLPNLSASTAATNMYLRTQRFFSAKIHCLQSLTTFRTKKSC